MDRYRQLSTLLHANRVLKRHLEGCICLIPPSALIRNGGQYAPGVSAISWIVRACEDVEHFDGAAELL
jgi:hypothetical protein